MPQHRNNMMTSSNGNIFRVTGPLCGEFTGPGEFPTQRPVTRSFDVYFDLRLNKRLSKQSWGWWFETLLCSLWRHRNENVVDYIFITGSYHCYIFITGCTWRCQNDNFECSQWWKCCQNDEISVSVPDLGKSDINIASFWSIPVLFRNMTAFSLSYTYVL